MTDNMFDKFVKDKLSDHKSSVPPGLWEKIERKKDKEPKAGFWLSQTTLWIGMFFIVASLSLGYYLMQQNNSINNKTQLCKTAAAKHNSSNTSKNNTTANNNNKTSLSTITANNNSEQKITTGTANSTINLVKNNSGNTVAGANKETTKNNRFINSSTHKILLANSGRNKKVQENNNSGELNNAGSINNNNEFPATPITGNVLSLTKGFTASIPLLLSLSKKEQFDLSQIKISGIDCPTTGVPRRNDWYLEVYASPDYTMKSVNAKGNTLYAKKKDSTETQQGGYTAGFRISKSIGENLLIKTGLQYSQINERFDLRTENERRIITVVTIRTVTSPSGIDSTIRDTSTVEQIGYRIQRTYNRYRSIDVPLLLSYEFGSDKLKFGVNAGVIFNLHSWYNGQALNDSLNVVSLNSKSSPIYKQNIGLGLYAGFSIIKPISNKLDVFAEPYFRYNLSNMATGAYSQKFNAAGLSLGIRYQLKGQRKTIK